jgi:glyoxylase-like metal-dependent hydrolase (beta-lactamase superfamily II)
VRDGEVLDLGNVKIQVLHTPGHTPEHISLLVTDKTRGPEPWFLLTGHTLMVGDVGRTELATAPEAGAAQLFGTIQRLKKFPNTWRYYLAHTLAQFAGEHSVEKLFRRLALSDVSTAHSRSVRLNNLLSSCCRVFLPRRQTPLRYVLLTRAAGHDGSREFGRSKAETRNT